MSAMPDTAHKRRIEYVDIDAIVPAARNPKRHDLDGVRRSIATLGYIDPVVQDERTGRLIGGHGRVEALQAMRDAGETAPDGVVAVGGVWKVPLVRGWASDDDRAAEAAVVALNRYVELGGWDNRELVDVLGALDAGLMAVAGYPDGMDDLLASLAEPASYPPSPSLAERFVAPPFSVLDTRQGYWQERKRQWLSLGIQSELGRGHGAPALHGGGERWPDSDGTISSRTARRNAQGPPPGGGGGGGVRLGKGRDGYEADGFAGNGRRAADQRSNVTGAAPLPDYATNGTEYIAPGTSIFDPVLCEIAYTWWSPPDGLVLDPFAGGSVRGIVAGRLGRRYHGVDLRADQVAANEEQAATILTDEQRAGVRWTVGDSRSALPDVTADLLFSCPPYFDLEVYSDDPADLSNADGYDTFRTAYADVITQAAARLAANSFAVLVVSEVRGSGVGAYHGLVPDTIAACTAAGLAYYNEAILVNMVGSLALRVGGPFAASRKLGRTHQNVLVFVKGDPRVATERCGPVDVALDVS